MFAKFTIFFNSWYYKASTWVISIYGIVKNYFKPKEQLDISASLSMISEGIKETKALIEELHKKIKNDEEKNEDIR